jgi:sulfate permease, SulP family
VPEHLPSGKPIVLSITGNLYFAAVRRVEELMPIPNGAKCPVVIIRLRNNRYLGSTGVHFLERYANRVQMQGGRLMVVGIEEQLRQQLKGAGGLESLGPENIFYATNVLFSATESALDDAATWLYIHYE